MRIRAAAAALAALIALAPSEIAHAQTPTAQAAPAQPQSQLLRLFLDCNECDTEYLRQNVLFVDYVRDRAVADVHLLVTTQGTGGGGREWTLKFIGLGRFAGQDRTLMFTTSQDATSDDQRKEFARVFRLGVVGYAADTLAAPKLDVTFTAPEGGVAAAQARTRGTTGSFASTPAATRTARKPASHARTACPFRPAGPPSSGRSTSRAGATRAGATSRSRSRNGSSASSIPGT